MTLLVSAGPALPLEDGHYAVMAIGHDPVRVVGGCQLTPDLIEQVGLWVSLNRAELYAHWLGHLDGVELARRLRPLAA